MKELIEQLESLGFGSDSNIDGAEVINVINEYWDILFNL